MLKDIKEIDAGSKKRKIYSSVDYIIYCNGLINKSSSLTFFYKLWHWKGWGRKQIIPFADETT